jgi:hypothetical protein
MTVEIPFGDNMKDQAILLLAAAEKTAGDQSLVRTTDSSFVVPEEVAKEAGLSEDKPEPKPTAAKKAPAKKAAAKKTSAKKK